MLRELRCELRAVHEDLRALHKDFRLLSQKPKQSSRLECSIGVTDKKERPKMITIDLTNLQIATITLAPKNRKGKPAKIDGVPVWTLVSGNCLLQPATDGKSAVITPPDELTDNPDGDVTTITAEADTDLGEGFVPLDETYTITVRPEPATTLGGIVTTTDKPDAPALRAAAATAPAKASKKSKSKKD